MVKEDAEVNREPQFDPLRMRTRSMRSKQISGSEKNENENDQDEEEQGKSDQQEPSDDEDRIRCEYCDRTYSKVSNLNAHIKTAHKGVRWICPNDECKLDFASKASLKRHIQRIHSGPMTKLGLRRKRRASEINLKEREFFGDDLTDGAKIAKIQRLENQIESKDKLIKTLKNKFKKAKDAELKQKAEILALKKENLQLQEQIANQEPTAD